MISRLEALYVEYHKLGLEKEPDNGRKCRYMLVTSSTALDQSRLTAEELAQILETGTSPAGRSIEEQLANVSLEAAYDKCAELAAKKEDFSPQMICDLASILARKQLSMPAHDETELLYTACHKINTLRRKSNAMNLWQMYDMTFYVHYAMWLLNIWPRITGRLARLLMNHVQLEMGVMPLVILPSEKRRYMSRLKYAVETGDFASFSRHMLGIAVRYMAKCIEQHTKKAQAKEKKKESADEISKIIDREIWNDFRSTHPTKTSEKILYLLEQNPRWGAGALAEMIGVKPKAIEKQFKRLREKGLLERVGSPKGGYWKIKK